MSKRPRFAFLAILAMVTSPQATLFAQSLKPSPEGQAFISPTEARFVFPQYSEQLYQWDVPIKGAYPGGAEFMWEVRWPDRYIRDGEDPLSLWLSSRWKLGGPHKGNLAKLIAGRTVDPMINCTTCDGAVFVDTERDTTKVFATVEGGRLVFNIHGRDAVRRIFSKTPDVVTFVRTVRQTPREHGPGDTENSQTILVNCHSAATEGRRSACIVPPKKKPPDPDSAAAANTPREVYVQVLRFSDASLVRNIEVMIKTPDNKVWAVMSTGQVGGFWMRQPPLGPLLLLAKCPRGSPTRTTISGTLFLGIAPHLDSTVHLMTDLTLCSTRGGVR
jgi:hypothetical protein